MTIAEQIKFAVDQKRLSYEDAITEAEEKSGEDIDQDWDLETTYYTFADDSVLKDWTGDLTAYGKRGE